MLNIELHLVHVASVSVEGETLELHVRHLYVSAILFRLVYLETCERTTVGLTDRYYIEKMFLVAHKGTALRQACLPLFGSLRRETPPSTSSLHDEACLSLFGSLGRETLPSTSSLCLAVPESRTRDAVVYDLCSNHPSLAGSTKK